VGKLKKNAFKTTIISYIGLLIGYLNKGVLFVYFLSTEEIGLINLILTIGVLFAQFSNLGVSYTIWRFFPFFKNKQTSNNGFIQFTLILNIVGVFIFTLLLILFKDLINDNYIKSPLFEANYFWIIPLGIFYSFFLTLDSILRAIHKNVVSIFAMDFLLRIMQLLVTLLFGFSIINFSYFVALSSICFVFPTVLVLIQLLRNKQFFWRFSQIDIAKRFRKILYNYTFYNYINFIGITVVLSLDTVMIASYIGLSKTGVYTTMIFLLSGVLIPYKTLQRFCQPMVAEYWKNKELNKLEKLYERVSSISLIFGFIIFIVSWTLKNKALEFLPSQFDEFMILLLIVLIGRIIDMYSGLNGLILLSSKKYKIDIIFTLFLLVVTVLLNSVLIPKYGVIGAAIATSVALILYNFSRLIYVLIIFKIHPFKKSQFYILMFFSASFIISTTFLSGINVWLNTIISLCLFLLPIILFKLNSDINSLVFNQKQLFKNNNE
jgi:O-antigen/teichoic acid export membrane protein